MFHKDLFVQCISSHGTRFQPYPLGNVHELSSSEVEGIMSTKSFTHRNVKVIESHKDFHLSLRRCVFKRKLIRTYYRESIFNGALTVQAHWTMSPRDTYTTHSLLLTKHGGYKLVISPCLHPLSNTGVLLGRQELTRDCARVASTLTRKCNSYRSEFKPMSQCYFLVQRGWDS